MHQTPIYPDDKKLAYELLVAQVSALVEAESDFIANCANISALCYEAMPQINWVGFYFFKDKQLVLGPFQGKVACTRMDWGKGVCMAAVLSKKTVNVANVHDFDGHIACDSASNSELVIPLIKDKQVIGVFDIDSPIFNRFDEIDETYTNQIIEQLLKNTKLDA